MARKPVLESTGTNDGWLNVCYKQKVDTGEKDPKGNPVMEEVIVQVGGIGISATNPRRASISANTPTDRPDIYKQLVLGNTIKDRLYELLQPMTAGEEKELPISELFLVLKKQPEEPKVDNSRLTNNLPI